MAESSTRSYKISNEAWAFLSLRLFLAIRWLYAGLDKFGSPGNYSLENYYAKVANMAGGIAENSIIPLWAAKCFAIPMGYIMLVLAATILLGVKVRISLIVSLLMYVCLSVGLMAVDEQHGIAWLGIHIILLIMALKMVAHAKWVVWKD